MKEALKSSGATMASRRGLPEAAAGTGALPAMGIDIIGEGTWSPAACWLLCAESAYSLSSVCVRRESSINIGSGSY